MGCCMMAALCWLPALADSGSTRLSHLARHSAWPDAFAADNTVQEEAPCRAGEVAFISHTAVLCMLQNTSLTTMTEAVKLFDSRTTGYVSWRCFLVAVLSAGVPAVLSASAQQLLDASMALAQGSADGKLTEQDFVQVRSTSSHPCRRPTYLQMHVLRQQCMCSCYLQDTRCLTLGCRHVSGWTAVQQMQRQLQSRLLQRRRGLTRASSHRRRLQQRCPAVQQPQTLQPCA